MSQHSNQLQHATSLHLQLHRNDPVAWQPWTDEVLAAAQTLNKPIFLSIGYSACHWCHLMQRETFSDPEIAGMMNEMFTNIKVDREERPDLDEVYQTAHRLLTGQAGGWPLNVFLCPRTRLPFLIGTYFPKEAKNGNVSFSELIKKVDGYYQNRGKDFLSTLDQVKQSFQALMHEERTLDKTAELNSIPIEKACGDILKDADITNGGFGQAPKFPMPTSLERLFSALLTKNKWAEPAEKHLIKSLLTMARSGINDQVGGGFFRYSVDSQWKIPQFEKMLYDNGQLLAIYSQVQQEKPHFELTLAIDGIAFWALNIMQSEKGGFYSSVDAEINETNGEFYLWSQEEIKDILSPQENGVIYAAYELDKKPNFNGKWHLHRDREWSALNEELELSSAEMESLIRAATEKLYDQRLLRKKPRKDKKIITAWNGLMIRGLAIAGKTMEQPQYIAAAQKAVDFIHENLWINQRLYATYQHDEPRILGFLSDYVYLMDGLLELLRAEWRDKDYRFLCLLAESMMENFEDTEHGGFYFTAHDQELLIYRYKPFFDSVLPAANGVAAKVLGRLGHLSTEPHYIEASKATLLCGWASMLRNPRGYHSTLQALSEYLNPPIQVLLKGDARMQSWQRAMTEQFGERVLCYWVSENSDFHPPEFFVLENNQGVVCLGDHCLEPRDQLSTLIVDVREALSTKQ